jgi:hypothetical protein
MGQLIDMNNPDTMEELQSDALISGARWNIAGNVSKFSKMNNKILVYQSMIKDFYQLYTKIQDILGVMLQYVDTPERARKINSFISEYKESYDTLIKLIESSKDIDEKLRIGNIKYGELRITVNCFINQNIAQLQDFVID